MYRYTRIYYHWANTINSAYNYMTFHGYEPWHLWGNVAQSFAAALQSLSGMVLVRTNIIHTYGLSPTQNPTPGRSVRQTAAMSFQCSDGNFRTVTVPCVPAPAGWKYTTELDAMAALLLSRPAGVVRDDYTPTPFVAFVGGYSSIDYNNNGGRKWKTTNQKR